MSGKPSGVEIPQDVLEEIYRRAREAFPGECCGWLTGARDGSAVTTVRPCANAQASGTHPTAPDRGAETAYVFAGADLLALNHSLDSDAPARVIYHSHPNGRAYFSDTDRDVALMLRYSLGLTEEAVSVERAVGRVLDDGYRTADIASEGADRVGTTVMGDLIVAALS